VSTNGLDFSGKTWLEVEKPYKRLFEKQSSFIPSWLRPSPGSGRFLSEGRRNEACVIWVVNWKEAGRKKPF
jgi:hypothetical protein